MIQILQKQVIKKLTDGTLDGYITGIDRSKDGDFENLSTHIYRGTFSNPEEGLCKWSMNDDGGFSIWRNNVSRRGFCKICLRKLLSELKVSQQT